ncbi:MAG: hypothetical protein PW843_17595 [Azospirillaceae bacterium]|nr:hypothetical protein [Azospirillaceae bacterium]
MAVDACAVTAKSILQISDDFQSVTKMARYATEPGIRIAYIGSIKQPGNKPTEPIGISP